MLKDAPLTPYYGLAGVAALAAFLISKVSKRPNLSGIPTVGSSNWLLSYWDGIKFVTDAPRILQEGYDKHREAPFKVANIHEWLVVVSGRRLLEELRNAPDDALSFLESANKVLKVEYTLGPEIHHNPYHIAIIRSQLTRNLSVLFDDIRDEIVTAFDDVLDLKDHEWKSVPAFDVIQQVVCRTSNRIFVGLPLCRDPDWIDLNIRFTLDVVKAAFTISLFPDLMAPLVVQFMTNIPRNVRRGAKHLGPIIAERQQYLDAYGEEWTDKPNDMLAWLMDAGSERTLLSMTRRLLSVNFAAIHTSSNSFTQALFNLAANPQYIDPLREEVESVVAKEGWSKSALVKMHKIDSFLKESQRMAGIGSLALTRVALKDFTFSNGTVIPKGVRVTFPSRAMHLDESIYENARAFEPFRFADIREEEGEGVKHQFVATHPDYLAFGHGRHACPGRFFAANELKSMLAHIVTTYDIKLEGPRPDDLHIGSATTASPTAKVMFRRRVV